MFALRLVPWHDEMSSADFSNTVPKVFSEQRSFLLYLFFSFLFNDFWFIAPHSVDSHCYRRGSLTE